MHSTTATHFQTSRAGGHHCEACDLACPQRATYAERETPVPHEAIRRGQHDGRRIVGQQWHGRPRGEGRQRQRSARRSR
jgi:hypothetical protein